MQKQLQQTDNNNGDGKDKSLKRDKISKAKGPKKSKITFTETQVKTAKKSHKKNGKS